MIEQLDPQRPGNLTQLNCKKSTPRAVKLHQDFVFQRAVMLGTILICADYKATKMLAPAKEDL